MKWNKRIHESMTTDSSPPPLLTSFVWIQGTHLEEGYVSERFASQKSGGEKERVGREGKGEAGVAR
jgi:hypothetical protein